MIQLTWCIDRYDPLSPGLLVGMIQITWCIDGYDPLSPGLLVDMIHAQAASVDKHLGALPVPPNPGEKRALEVGESGIEWVCGSAVSAPAGPGHSLSQKRM